MTKGWIRPLILLALTACFTDSEFAAADLGLGCCSAFSCRLLRHSVFRNRAAIGVSPDRKQPWVERGKVRYNFGTFERARISPVFAQATPDKAVSILPVCFASRGHRFDSGHVHQNNSPFVRELCHLS